jgi:hypothetical protein
MGFFSRYVRERLIYPSPLTDRAAFAWSVVRRANFIGNPVLFAFSDSTLLPLVGVPQGNASWNWLLPQSPDCFEAAFDKGRTLDLARAVGIEGPATYAEATGDGLPAFLERHDFPVVVKPRRSVYWNSEDRGIQVTASFAASADDLKIKCTSVLSQTGEFPLVQEYVAGEEASVQFLCDRGAVVAACANRRLRSVSPGGGPGALKETIPLSYVGMAQRARRLGAALKWSGPMMVEFKIDHASGVPKLMEINGRFWGSLPLAIFAGVDFPYLYYRLSQGHKVGPCESYPEGVVSRHFMGDAHHLFSTLFKRDPMRASAYPKRMRALRDFFALPKGCKSDVLDRRDILPAFAEIMDTGVEMLSRYPPANAKEESPDSRRSRDDALTRRRA